MCYIEYKTHYHTYREGPFKHLNVLIFVKLKAYSFFFSSKGFGVCWVSSDSSMQSSLCSFVSLLSWYSWSSSLGFSICLILPYWCRLCFFRVSLQINRDDVNKRNLKCCSLPSLFHSLPVFRLGEEPEEQHHHWCIHHVDKTNQDIHPISSTPFSVSHIHYSNLLIHSHTKAKCLQHWFTVANFNWL